MTKEELSRPFECEDGNIYMAHPKSCFFCDHCIDIFYDSNGPYGFVCDINEGSGDKAYNKVFNFGIRGKCTDFKVRKLTDVFDE